MYGGSTVTVSELCEAASCQKFQIGQAVVRNAFFIIIESYT